VAGASTACGDDSGDGRGVPDPAGAAVTSFADLDAPSGDALLPGLDTATPAPGTVDQVVGPFDDRFAFADLALRDGTVTGTLTVTSDVSELLELEVQVGFYDAAGGYLGTASFVHHHEESQGHEAAGTPDESERFQVRAPRSFAGRVDAAVVGVPVLVNE